MQFINQVNRFFKQPSLPSLLVSGPPSQHRLSGQRLSGQRLSGQGLSGQRLSGQASSYSGQGSVYYPGRLAV